MRKTFHLSHPKIKPANLIDSAKFDVKKYIKRERRKTLPDNTDFWDFDCKFGKTEASAKTIHLTAINKCIDDAGEKNFESFYLEILAKAVKRTKKPKDE